MLPRQVASRRSCARPKAQKLSNKDSSPRVAVATAGALNPGVVFVIKRAIDLDVQLDCSGGRWVIVEFTVSSAMPSLFMKRAFEGLAREFATTLFLRVDVEELPQCAQKHGITRVPTFALFWGGERETDFAGCSERKLREVLTGCVSVGPKVAFYALGGTEEEVAAEMDQRALETGERARLQDAIQQSADEAAARGRLSPMLTSMLSKELSPRRPMEVAVLNEQQPEEFLCAAAAATTEDTGAGGAHVEGLPIAEGDAVEDMVDALGSILQGAGSSVPCGADMSASRRASRMMQLMKAQIEHDREQSRQATEVAEQVVSEKTNEVKTLQNNLEQMAAQQSVQDQFFSQLQDRQEKRLTKQQLKNENNLRRLREEADREKERLQKQLEAKEREIISSLQVGQAQQRATQEVARVEQGGRVWLERKRNRIVVRKPIQFAERKFDMEHKAPPTAEIADGEPAATAHLIVSDLMAVLALFPGIGREVVKVNPFPPKPRTLQEKASYEWSKALALNRLELSRTLLTKAGSPEELTHAKLVYGKQEAMYVNLQMSPGAVASAAPEPVVEDSHLLVASSQASIVEADHARSRVESSFVLAESPRTSSVDAGPSADALADLPSF